MIMLSPLSWDHYQVLLLIPYVQVATAYNRGKAGGAPLTMAIVSYCLTVVFSAVFLSVSVPVANGLPLVGSKWLAPLVLLQLMVPMTAYVAACWTIKGQRTRAPVIGARSE